MFELYFGAFDILLYALAFITAVMVSGGICDVMDAQAIVSSSDSDRAKPSYVSCDRSIQPTSTAVIARPAAEASIAVPAPSSAPAPSQPVLRISDIRLYKLHQRSVVMLSALPFTIPESIKRYMLRGEPVVRLESLRSIATVIA